MKLLIPWLAVAATSCLAAGDDRLDPDRRDFTTGTGIVAAGRLQVEGGAQFSRGDDARHWTIGDVTVRIPLAEWAELRLLVPTYRIDHDPDRAAGYDDAGAELRLRLLRREQFELALQLTTMVPSGARRVAERYAQPGAVLAVLWKPADGTALAVNVGGSRASSGGVHFTQGYVAASLRQDVGARWNLFAESYVFNRDERGGSSRQYVAAGAAWFATRDLAFDARIGRGIGNSHGIDTLASAGVSVRF